MMQISGSENFTPLLYTILVYGSEDIPGCSWGGLYDRIGMFIAAHRAYICAISEYELMTTALRTSCE